jgi:hypothetical protein
MLSHCWIAALSLSSSAAWLYRSPEDVYTPNMCRTTEVLPFVAPIFVELFDYTTLRSASVVFIDNVHAGMTFLLSVFNGMNTVATLLPYIYIG